MSAFIRGKFLLSAWYKKSRNNCFNFIAGKCQLKWMIKMSIIIFMLSPYVSNPCFLDNIVRISTKCQLPLARSPLIERNANYCMNFYLSNYVYLYMCLIENFTYATCPSLDFPFTAFRSTQIKIISLRCLPRNRQRGEKNKYSI